MEDQINPQDSNSALFQLHLDISNSYVLRNAASWAKVMGVVGIIVGILLMIITIITITLPPSMPGNANEGFEVLPSQQAAAGFGAGILIFAGILFVIGGIFSFSFGSRIINALKSNDQNGLDRGFTSLRNYYALRAVVLILVALLFLIMLAGLI